MATRLVTTSILRYFIVCPSSPSGRVRRLRVEPVCNLPEVLRDVGERVSASGMDGHADAAGPPETLLGREPPLALAPGPPGRSCLAPPRHLGGGGLVVQALGDDPFGKLSLLVCNLQLRDLV